MTWLLDGHKLLSNADALTVGRGSGDAPSCPQCGRAIGMLDWTGDAVISIDHLNGPMDDLLLPAGRGNSVVISDRFLEVYRELNGTGMVKEEPAKVTAKPRIAKRLPSWSFRRVDLVRFGRVDDVTSQIEREPGSGCEYCGGGVRAVRNGIHLEEPSPYDLWIPFNYNAPLASNRLVEAVLEAGLVVPTIRRCSEERYDFYA